MSEKPKNENLSKFPPAWGWLFIIACVAIPIVALGGAIPAGLGGGGAAGCYQIARDNSKSTQTRVLQCLGITVVVWAIFGALIYFVFSVT